MGVLSIEQILAEEARNIHACDASRADLVTAVSSLKTDQTLESNRSDKDADERSGRDEDPEWVKNRRKFYCDLNRIGRAALCCSGGGIRSATFCLGIIQGLAKFAVATGGASPPANKSTGSSMEDAEPTMAKRAEESLLSRFHYLSTVSGGGYIGSWLSAWRNRNDFPTVWESLSGRPDGPDVEPAELSWLRAYSNYLTPRVGLFSADTWTGIAIYMRNLLLNWLVIIPAVAVVLLVLKLLITSSVAVARSDALWLPFAVAFVGIAFLLVAQAFTTSHRPTRRTLTPFLPLARVIPAKTDAKTDDKSAKPEPAVLVDEKLADESIDNIDQATFLKRDLIWSLASAIALTGALSSAVGVQLVGGFTTPEAMGIGALLGVVIYAAGWLIGNPLRWTGHDWGRWAASGMIYGGLIALGAHLYAGLMPYANGPSRSIWMILLPVILGVPWVLFSQMMADMVFVGLVSYQLNSDADREWLGRASGWVAATAILWLLATFISFAGDYFLIDVAYGQVIAPYIASAGGLAGVITAWLGKSALTKATPPEGKQSISSLISGIGLALAGPIFAAALIVGISIALDLLLLGDSLIDGLTENMWSYLYIFSWLLIGLAVTTAVAWIASSCVNINRFSIHALYRNRLMRAYLAASRQRRRPDRFTGFDGNDNLPAHVLWPPQEWKPKKDSKDPPKNNKNAFCLFHVVNITLNVVKATRLAWQQRKAESFTVSPLHSGAGYKGFRKSIEYAGPPNGITLGTAMAISGAAASPNMGYHTSPSVSLLLALFNVRLGWWLGNPGKEGDRTYQDEGPSKAIKPLVEETFGLTTDNRPYVYLSDGGHFENLGIYEMVRRRCRLIVAIDAGCDPDFKYEDLGNAVRKIYIDLGVRIVFETLDKLKNRPKSGELSDAKPIPYFAVGTIRYQDADADPNAKPPMACKDGYVIYIKPAYHGTSRTEGAGVCSYALAHDTFPHESTGDQWFTESQFESYRSLGLDIAKNIFAGDVPLGNGLTLSVLLKELASTAVN